jgi:hypothetical protein
MTDLRKAAEDALKVLEEIGPANMYAEEWAVTVKLRAALAEPEPEPDDYDWAGRWVLREVFFGDDGDPIAHREPQQTRRAALNFVHRALQDEASISYVQSDAETYGFEEPKP